MNLHEYQSKELFSDQGIPVLNGMVADGRGKAGGVKLASNLNEVELIASKMLGSRLVTKQTDQIGLPINLVYIEIGIQIKREFYLSLVIDRSKESWTFIGSSEGGVDIEMVAEKTPERIT